MLASKDLHIETGFEPDSLVGKQFERGSTVFELASILRAGADGIVYEARDVQTGQGDHVLKVYRTKLSDEESEQKQATYRRCADILGDGFLDGEFLRIGDWTVMFAPKVFGAVPSSARVSQVERKRGTESPLDEIVELCAAGDFARAVQKCDKALEDRPPITSFYHRLKGIALLGMGESRAASEALDLCFASAPDETSHYVAIINVCVEWGQIIRGRKWARQGASRARDKRKLYNAWFELEEQAERVDLLRMCLAQLRLLEEPEPVLEDLRKRVQALEERLARCERELQGAWRLLQQRRLEEAKQVAHRLIEAHPYHVPALFFSSVLAMEQSQWAEVIRFLHGAFARQPAGNPDVPFLLGLAYLKLGKIHHATVMHSVWQQHYHEAAVALQARSVRWHASAVANAELKVQSEWEQRLVDDPVMAAEQSRGILNAYRAVSSADPQTRERIAEVVQGTERLLGWLGRNSYEKGAT